MVNTMSLGQTNSPAPSDEERAWVVAKTLLDATNRSFRALELHARYALYHDEEADPDELARHLEQAKTEHERIVEDIDAALESLDTDS
jgi:hypothetical protein